MTYLVLSDSHHHPRAVAEAIERTRPDGLLFAGDGLRDLTCMDISCPVWAVRGNCDTGTMPLVISHSALGSRLLDPDDEELISLDGAIILLIHGHRYGVKHSLMAAAARGVTLGADAVIFGHTHEPLEWHLTPDRPGPLGGEAAPKKPLILFNPGSIGDYSGSFGTVTVRNGQMLCGHGRLR